MFTTKIKDSCFLVLPRSGFNPCLHVANSSFLLLSVTTSGLKIIEYFSFKHKLHFWLVGWSWLLYLKFSTKFWKGCHHLLTSRQSRPNWFLHCSGDSCCQCVHRTYPYSLNCLRWSLCRFLWFACLHIQLLVKQI